ncbi:OmpA family protein [Escherichia coli]|nr:OmpA family protein [Escherichia coli]
MSFYKNILSGLMAVILTGCGNLSNVSPEGTTDEPVWPSPDRTMFSHSGTQKGSWPVPEKLRLIKAGMNKDQIYQLVGRPHFGEGIAGVREWDYLFNFTGPDGDYVCQFKILFDRHMDARSFFWKPENCSQEQEVKRYERTLQGDILFDHDSSVLTEKGREQLMIVAEELRKEGGRRFIIEGHTDHTGSEPYNNALSEKRAGTVKGWFISQGFDAGNIEIRGKGDKEPLVVCENTGDEVMKECLRPNRRVVITAEEEGDR